VSVGGANPDTVGALAELYLGNILYSLETTALAFDQQQNPEAAAFYRGIARELAEAHGRASAQQGRPGVEPLR
jgi:hypothetical protein